MIFSKHEGKRTTLNYQWWLAPSVVAATTCSLIPFVLLAPGAAQNLNKNMNKSTELRRASEAYIPQSEISEAQSVHAFGYLRSGFSPAPEAGVQLLETIFNRVMNIPQVALTKSTNSQIIAQNLKQQNSINEKTNYSLAIRPKETGKVFAAPPPSLQIAQALPEPKPVAAPMSAPSAARQTIAAKAESADMASTEQWRGSAKIKNEASNLLLADAPAKPGVWEDAANNWSANRRALMAPSSRGAMLSQASNNAPSLQGASADGFGAPGFAAGGLGSSTTMMGKGSQVTDNLFSEEAQSSTRSKPLPLATSVNKLYGLGKRLDEVQAMAQNGKLSELKTNARSKKDWNSAPREIAIMDDRPVVRDFREAPEQIADKESSKKKIALNSDTSTSVNGILSNKSRSRAYLDTDSLSAGKDKVAMLPPNVVTGIPLGNVTLGKSETQVVSSIGQIGKLKQHKVKNWTVYSWSKKNSDGREALQLYFRRGTLEAIRIFDSSLIGTDFGVSPGDKLENVKEKFGEPAFLLPEPGGSSKNYIYPISQVGFQLARAAESSPQVVSVLIFSVK